MNSSLPKVTVLMPVYNCALFLAEAIQSILSQTYTDFEFIIIDDGSTDGSYDLAAAFSDSRIRLIRQNENKGVVEALNLGIDSACGEFIALMHADDISLPNRLSKQVDFMESNPSVGICGSWLLAFSESERMIWPSPLTHNSIHARLLFESGLYHPTIIFRRSVLIAQALRYVEGFPCAEDYELWSRCVSHLHLANIGEVLLHYRVHANSFGNRDGNPKLQSADIIRLRSLQSIGLQPSSDDVVLHRQISHGNVPYPLTVTFLEKSHSWLLKIMDANSLSKACPEPELIEELASLWFLVCNRSTPLGPVVIYRYFGSPLCRHYPGNIRAVLALIVKGFLRWSGR